MKVTICMGSACFLKGSKKIADALTEYIERYNLKEKIDLCGAFCMGRCRDGVNVEVDGEIFSVSPETVDVFFKERVLSKLGINNIL